jgi:hypothetical protein
MEQQYFSHGLLYSVPPESFSSLHLQEEERVDDFDWGEYESQLSGDSIPKVILSFLKQTAIHWGITKP